MTDSLSSFIALLESWLKYFGHVLHLSGLHSFTQSKIREHLASPDHVPGPRQMITVLVRVSIPAQTSWPRSKLGRKGFIQLTFSTLLLITKGSQNWNSSRSGSRSWCRGHGGMFFTGLLSLACSACFLIEPKTTSPGMAPPTRGSPHLITNWENAPQLDLMEVFP